MTFFSVEVDGDKVRVEAEGLTLAVLARLLDAYELGPVRPGGKTDTPPSAVPSAAPQTTSAPAPTTTLTCDECGKGGMTKQGLAVHVARKHKNEAGIVGIFRCDTCAFTSTSFDTMRKHTLSKHDRLPKQGPA